MPTTSPAALVATLPGVHFDPRARASAILQDVMPKPITLEMLHAMDPEQRKNLHRNASGLDTPAARAVLELLSQDDLMGKPKAPPKAAAPRKTKARTTPAKPRAAKAAAEPKAAVYGRQA